MNSIATQGEAAVAHVGQPRYRPVALGSAPPAITRDGDVWYLKSTETLDPYPARITDRLIDGANAHPDRWLAARRNADGNWFGISYAEMLTRARAIGQALLARNLGADRPVMVLSGNDLDHLQLTLGALMAGVPFAPVSPAYALVSSDFGKLRHAVETLTPGLVLVSDLAAYRAALTATTGADVEIVTSDADATTLDDGRTTTPFAALLQTVPTTIDAHHASLGPDTLAKFLFTSGSTRLPKAVPTTQRMLCSNQQMLRQTFPQFAVEPPVLVDWLPWSHTFGGSHNVGIVLYNGGTLYIDDGRPTPQQFPETLRNLREVAPTVYFNVPKGWEELAAALETDQTLRDTFFSNVKLYFFAGAGLSQAAWNRLERVTEQYCGTRIRIMAGLGMTETSPSSLFTTGPLMCAGYLGLPAPGCETKLVPVDGKLEMRFRGPHVMAGYWRLKEGDPRDAFDDEGYYRTGDAATFANPEHPEWGLMFDGRIAEDFKLNTGTFVSVGPLRARVVSEGAPYVQDVVVTGLDRADIGLMVFPRVDECRALAGLPPQASVADVIRAPAVKAFFADLLTRLNQRATGSATYVARLCLLEQPPSLAIGEITDKGSINQRVVLKHRAQHVDTLHAADDDHPDVLHAPR
ncbi:feruloyl-CoA synthase [Paraburkholderia sp.]|uniref:feruloyl-CoA synthase n=1 Tax=Paraburkholderia sp. TaxID=1926495 RepID=UPI002382D7FF|nr:feruloyl-CoA synthase [Paraburkholderia sp.]MDE1180376.1 feruloyl-CoA synthase [Paraburkholderia sp.]